MRSAGQESAPAESPQKRWPRISISPTGTCSTHGLRNQLIRGFRQKRVGCLAVNGFAADFQHDRDRKWRHLFQRFMDDSPLDARERVTEAADVEEPGGS